MIGGDDEAELPGGLGLPLHGESLGGIPGADEGEGAVHVRDQLRLELVVLLHPEGDVQLLAAVVLIPLLLRIPRVTRPHLSLTLCHNSSGNNNKETNNQLVKRRSRALTYPILSSTPFFFLISYNIIADTRTKT